MQNRWIYKKVEYKDDSGFFEFKKAVPDEEQLRSAMDDIVASANLGGWTITALTYLPHEKFMGGSGSFLAGVTIVATLSKP